MISYKGMKGISNFTVFRILGYSEPWDIQNRRDTQNLFKRIEHFKEQLAAIIIFTCYNYFCNTYHLFISSGSLNKYHFFNADLIFTPEVFIQCKKVWETGSRCRGP